MKWKDWFQIHCSSHHSGLCQQFTTSFKYIFCLFFPRSAPDMSDSSKLKLIWHIKYIIPKRQWHIEISFFHQSICRICYKWKPIIKFIVGERERERGREEERRRERVWSKWSNFSISSLATTNDTVSTYDIKLHLNGSCWSLSSNAMKSILFKVNDAFILCFFSFIISAREFRPLMIWF